MPLTHVVDIQSDRPSHTIQVTLFICRGYESMEILDRGKYVLIYTHSTLLFRFSIMSIGLETAQNIYLF